MGSFLETQIDPKDMYNSNIIQGTLSGPLASADPLNGGAS